MSAIASPLAKILTQQQQSTAVADHTTEPNNDLEFSPPAPCPICSNGKLWLDGYRHLRCIVCVEPPSRRLIRATYDLINWQRNGFEPSWMDTRAPAVEIEKPNSRETHFGTADLAVDSDFDHHPATNWPGEWWTDAYWHFEQAAQEKFAGGFSGRSHQWRGGVRASQTPEPTVGVDDNVE